MFYLRYMLSELRRRRRRTLLTALGLVVGSGSSSRSPLSRPGSDRAQKAVPEPLTGIGTDLQHDKAARAADLDAKREQAERVRWRIASVVRAGAPAR